MFPPAFQVAAASPTVQAALGSSPVRFYPFGEAPQNEQRPYAVWQTAYGSPENYIGDTPDIDTWGVQVDCFALTINQVRDSAKALRDVFEPVAHIVGWRGETRDADTNLYRYSFDVEFWTPR